MAFTSQYTGQRYAFRGMTLHRRHLQTGTSCCCHILSDCTQHQLYWSTALIKPDGTSATLIYFNPGWFRFRVSVLQKCKNAKKKKIGGLNRRWRQTQFLCKLDISGANVRCLRFKHNKERPSSSGHLRVSRVSGRTAKGTDFCQPERTGDPDTLVSSDGLWCQFGAHFLQKHFH